MRSILIIKTSSLGDIAQAFPVLEFLRDLFPKVAIDWVVEKKFAQLVADHPLVRQAKILNRKELARSFREIRQISYDVVFDLQGNSKSALVCLLSRGNIKVGFGLKSVREWPNLFATHVRFNVPSSLNIRFQYLSLISQFYQVSPPVLKRPETQKFLIRNKKTKVMICLGSQWANKQLSFETALSFLRLVQKEYDPVFLLMWGSEKERSVCEKIHEAFLGKSLIIDKLSLTEWQKSIAQVDLVIAMDSSALHLCATTSTPSFSIFGPTSPSIFKPLGEHHLAFQGTCPYGKVFEKQCPLLRSCPTGACMKQISPTSLFQSFSTWWNQYH